MTNQVDASSVCIVTGANSGVGFATAIALAKQGEAVVMVCRDSSRGEDARKRIQKEVPSATLHLRLCDLSSLEQVRTLGPQLAAEFPKISLLVNNAGVYRAKFERSEDGYEQTFAVNHLAHFLLTHLLEAPLLSVGGRVINVSSEGHRSARLAAPALEKMIRGETPYNGIMAYAVSKLANVLFTLELARRHEPTELCAVSLHPGALATSIWNQNSNPLSLLVRLAKPFMPRPSVGGDAIAFLARQPADQVHGKYFNKKREVQPGLQALDEELARDVWKLSADLAGTDGYSE